MSYHPFRTFIDLITYDQVSHSLEMELKELEQSINELKDKEHGILVASEDAKKVVHNLRKEVDAQELAMKDLEQAEEQKNKRLDSATDQKMYQSIKNELDRIKQKQHEYEESLVAIWNKLESAQDGYKKKEAEYESKIASLKMSMSEKIQKVEEIKATLKSRYDKRPEMQKNIPEEWLEKYSLMRSRVSDPVVPVLHGSCSACFYLIPEQDMLMLKKNKLLQCKSCYRFLFLENAEEKRAEEKV